MRDASLDRGNAYLASLRSACDIARREVDAFPDAEFIVSSFAKWCRDVIFTRTGWIHGAKAAACRAS